MHRRLWLLDRIKLVTSVFDIDVCFYAIMSNHMHMVLRVGDTTEWPSQSCADGMAYVDLNPIRAGMAKPLGDSEFTSIQERINNKSTWLSSFGKRRNDLPYYLSSYIDLVDESGRCVRDDAYMDVGVSREQDAEATKRCFIPKDSAKTIDQLGISPDTWLEELKGFKSVGFSAVGTAAQLKEFSRKTNKQWSLGFRLKLTLE